MKRLCVFYKNADLWCGRLDVEWIVCKGCQRKLRSGEMMPPMSSSVGKARRILLFTSLLKKQTPIGVRKPKPECHYIIRAGFPDEPMIVCKCTEYIPERP